MDKWVGTRASSTELQILFLFFNADLVRRHIDGQGGAVAFVDDFTAWVTGPSTQSNRRGIEAIINQALDWERRSGYKTQIQGTHREGSFQGT